MKLKIKKGDTVKVISGSAVGKQGEVLDVDRKNNRVTIEGITSKKHVKPQTNKENPDGGIIDVNKSIHISNVMLIDPKTGEPTKIGRKVEGDKIVRYAKKSGEVLN
ncbi:MAG: 50S ribosomal protein L24 [Flavobacteriales bacterium]|nr:50S ribosomal protein L24 [Flavobacteriales bacterium]MCB9198221.1 50S ribosomal protein L24 [Flavobacteriales bacterium]